MTQPIPADAPLEAESMRHARRRPPSAGRTLTRWVLAAVGVVAVSAVALVGGIAAQIAGNITGNSFVIGSAAEAEALPEIGQLEGGVNMLIVGSDTRSGRNSTFGADEGGQLNDVNILVHISEDQDNVVVVSLPRDLIVPFVPCEQPGGGSSGTSAGLPLNNAFYYGGLGGTDDESVGYAMNCAVTIVENLTGLDIPYAAMIDFQGVIELSDAVGGVDICISGGDLYDPDSRVFPGDYALSLTEGPHTISGGTALAYLRSRHGVGNGGDLGRISSQQAYLSSLMRKVKDDGVLGDLPTLYRLATAATANMKLSSSLTNVNTLIGLARILSGIDLDKIAFVQYPTTADPADANKLVPDVTPAAALMDAIKADEAVKPTGSGVGSDHTGGSGDSGSGDSGSGDSGSGDSGSDDGVAIDGLTGQLANEVTCSIANN